ncbi:MAG: hypothetical protein FWG64_13015 [Firmicutes bacterium]|nr:hypothetical protein [Bacillota bacterium]
MNCKFKLKEKTDKKVVYYYSADISRYEEKLADIVPDGIMEYLIKEDELRVVKPATHDEKGLHGERFLGKMWRLATRENCPQERFIACG